MNFLRLANLHQLVPCQPGHFTKFTCRHLLATTQRNGRLGPRLTSMQHLPAPVPHGHRYPLRYETWLTSLTRENLVGQEANHFGIRPFPARVQPLMRRIHARPGPAARVDLWGGNPCIRCIFMLRPRAKKSGGCTSTM